jgi:hypothetical protein
MNLMPQHMHDPSFCMTPLAETMHEANLSSASESPLNFHDPGTDHKAIPLTRGARSPKDTPTVRLLHACIA